MDFTEDTNKLKHLINYVLNCQHRDKSSNVDFKEMDAQRVAHLLYLIDREHYLIFGKPITGVVYQAHLQGPQLPSVVQSVIEEEFSKTLESNNSRPFRSIEENSKIFYQANPEYEFQKELFDPQELETIEVLLQELLPSSLDDLQRHYKDSLWSVSHQEHLPLDYDLIQFHDRVEGFGFEEENDEDDDDDDELDEISTSHPIEAKEFRKIPPHSYHEDELIRTDESCGQESDTFTIFRSLQAETYYQKHIFHQACQKDYHAAIETLYRDYRSKSLNNIRARYRILGNPCITFLVDIDSVKKRFILEEIDIFS